MLTKLKNRIRLFFGFSASETNGLLLLVPILLLILAAPSILKSVLASNSTQSDLEDQRILRAWLEESKSKLKSDDGVTFIPTFFDPNQINSDKWVQLGFKKNIAKRIVNYRAKGGVFRKKEDLLKIYGINQKLVTAYYDYIVLPKPETQPKAALPKFKQAIEKMVVEKNNVKFDLNLADTAQFQLVKGIGPVLSERIVKYREMLGGFTSTEQLQEVYGIKPEVYQRMLNDFDVLVASNKKININEDSISFLAKHPYLSYKTSRAIIKYRAQHGDYQSVDDLKKIHTISDSLFQRIKPYLKVETTE
ncbi:MAG: helix-hairpin-helix domain-containing protein [Reichenbachiella sp.]|uniref:ComEA family DNA-binding protein n=1 Tax=Reichenbachiella sp. TaxID=2184521 RepID=UPI0029669CA7|nr:helix-hairpin-helix domain-containing protein [Reichenbachiella sp.]MDW3208258.1 helix-hairpin-helix domain-containing protein [Reichenbachiella sp.]